MLVRGSRLPGALVPGLPGKPAADDGLVDHVLRRLGHLPDPGRTLQLVRGNHPLAPRAVDPRDVRRGPQDWSKTGQAMTLGCGPATAAAPPSRRARAKSARVQCRTVPHTVQP